MLAFALVFRSRSTRAPTSSARTSRTSLARFRAWVRTVAMIVALPLMSVGALPYWASLLGIEGPHVCHCSLEKHDCLCVKCHPDQEDLVLTTASLSGRCGDDEHVYGGKAIRAVPPSTFGRAPPPLSTLAILDAPAVLAAGLRSPPPTPPPRG